MGRRCSAAGKLTASLAKVMAAYHRVDDLVTCGLTACTPVSAPGPAFGNEYGKPVPFNVVFTDQIPFLSSKETVSKNWW